MEPIELRISIEAHYSHVSCEAFLRKLHWHIWGMLWGGLASPASHSEDICKMWIFNVVKLHSLPGVATRVLITIETRYSNDEMPAEQLMALVDKHMKQRLDFALTVPEYTCPVGWEIRIAEKAFNVPELTLKAG